MKTTTQNRAALTAKHFVARLKQHASPSDAAQMQRYFKTAPGEYGAGDVFIGVRMGNVFALAKEFAEMPLDEIEKLLESPIHEARAGAVSIMDFQARRKKTSDARRKELFELYLRRHDRINNWDLVDRSAMYVVGGYLYDKPRAVLYRLARSKNVWERRTAIVSTAYFIRQRDLDDTFKLAEMLLRDEHDLIHKATGWMLRAAGDADRKRLLEFLEQHAATMPRTMLRYAIEHFDQKQRAKYMKKRVTGKG